MLVHVINMSMSWAKVQLILVVCFFLSFIFTYVLRRYALAKNILDFPNQRSSHQLPTPRGGGVAFVLVYCAFVGIMVSFKLALLSFLIALIGWLDDRAWIGVRMRLLGHFGVSIFALASLHWMPEFKIFDYVIPELLINTFAVFYLVWLLNLYNFMDGINGIAALEAISVCFGMIFIYVSNSLQDLVGLPLVLLCAVAGFLCWNFPKARIFMGDSGSGCLGFTLGLFSILAAQQNLRFFYSWLIFLCVFIVDATITLMIRTYKRQKIYQAHRSHAYQRATLRYNSHSFITICICLINIFWLLPWAYYVGNGSCNWLLGIFCAYVPIVFLTLYFKAGKS